MNWESERTLTKRGLKIVKIIMNEDKISFYKNRKIPLKWQKLFSIEIFTRLFFDYYSNKLVITNMDIYYFFRKKGYKFDEDSPYKEIIKAAKIISQKYYIRNIKNLITSKDEIL